MEDIRDTARRLNHRFQRCVGTEEEFLEKKVVGDEHFIPEYQNEIDELIRVCDNYQEVHDAWKEKNHELVESRRHHETFVRQRMEQQEEIDTLKPAIAALQTEVAAIRQRSTGRPLGVPWPEDLLDEYHEKTGELSGKKIQLSQNETLLELTDEDLEYYQGIIDILTKIQDKTLERKRRLIDQAQGMLYHLNDNPITRIIEFDIFT